MKNIIRPTIILFVSLTLLCGVLYPAVVTVIAQTLFKDQANGSLITYAGKIRGSRLIGQEFTSPGHFWGRLSATGPMPYNAANSGGSNLAPSNPALAEAVKARIAALHAADPGNQAPIPVDLVTASASGLDPEISLASARYQLGRVARARAIAPAQLEAVVARHTSHRWFGFFGEERVNIVTLNLDLDGML